MTIATLWSAVYPLLLTGLTALAGWALAKLGSYLAALSVHTNTWKVLTVLDKVAQDTLTKFGTQIEPQLGKVPARDIAASLLQVALSEVNALGSDVLDVAGWSQNDAAKAIVGLLETAIAGLAAGKASAAPVAAPAPVPVVVVKSAVVPTVPVQA